MRLKMILASFALALAINACGGGGNLAADGEGHADDTCACTGFDCTTEHIAWFNKVTITQEADLDALSADDRARYEAAEERAADCQTALR